MGKSSELFIQMRELDYASEFSKKQAQLSGQNLSKRIIEEGNVSIPDAVTRLTRLAEVVNTSLKNLKDDLDFEGKELSLNGVKFSKVEGGAIYDFAKDAAWQHMENEISRLKALQKEREKRLIEAYKESQKIDEKDRTEIWDEGVEVKAIPLKGYKKSYVKMTW